MTFKPCPISGHKL